MVDSRGQHIFVWAEFQPGDSWGMPTGSPKNREFRNLQLVGIVASYLVGLHTHKSWMKLITSKLR